MTSVGALGGESDAVALRSGTGTGGGGEAATAPGEKPRIVPRDVPVDEREDLPEELKEGERDVAEGEGEEATS
ncbi:hypothetical protein [Actinomadura parmotrematis]|uniref:Preprotein translocase YidC n=1 Tax=Actinomadura parmotrematis TaxID=2864039 RepID=A0ABS7FTR6_9ACTN|nr:hypothetical protein [Actinomadura parmotrematis]MBW8483129.1 hypothetical protein [Actinomadura parmotrematis]